MQFSLHSGLMLSHGDKAYELMRLVEDDVVLEETLTRRPKTMRRTDLLNGIWDKHWRILIDVPNSSPPEELADVGPRDLSTLVERDLQVVTRKMAYVEGIRKRKLRRGMRKKIQDLIPKIAKNIEDEKPPSASSVMDWCRDYEKSGNSPWALVDGNLRRRRHKRLKPRVEEVIRRVLKNEYFNLNRLTIRHAADMIARELTVLVKAGEVEEKDGKVSYSTVAKRVLDVDVYDRVRSREGADRARAVMRTTFKGSRSWYVLQRVEVDHTPLNWVVLDDRTSIPLGRPVLTVVVDSFSGYVLGFYISFYGPGVTSVCGVLRNAVMPKVGLCAGVELEHPWLAEGLGDEWALDNGLEFHSKVFKLISWTLGIDLMYCRVRTPWSKPKVERFFGNLNFLTLTKGRVHQSKANIPRYDPYSDACIYFSDLVRGLLMYVVDEYPFNPNERKLLRPYDQFAEGLERCPPVNYPGTWDDLRLVSGMSAELTVGPGGVELRGIPYGGGELLAMRKRTGERIKTLVKWDPDDINQISIRNPIDQSWITSFSRIPEYTLGLSWNQHLQIRKYAREKLKVSGAYDTLQATRLRMHEFWQNAIKLPTRHKIREFDAGVLSGVTSAKVLGQESNLRTQPGPKDAANSVHAAGLASSPIIVADDEFDIDVRAIPTFNTYNSRRGA